VLVSRQFYYFGNQAITLPGRLQHLIIDRHGCKKVADEDIDRLLSYVTRRFAPGVHGMPNNPEPPLKSSRACGIC
jgi:hypothetical protein